MIASAPKILTVDDSKTVRRILASLFVPFGCTLCEAVNGEEGLTVAAREKPDLILLDYNMPVMDGTMLMGVISFYDVAKAVVDGQNFENKMLKAYIRDWPVEEPRDEKTS